MDVTDTVLATVTVGVVLLCCVGTISASFCCIRKHMILRQSYRQRLSTEDEFIA